MLNIGPGEMFVMFVVGLLIFGPNRLPEMARTLGKAVRTFQAETRKASEVLRAGLEETTTLPGIVDTPDGAPGESDSPLDPESRRLEDT